MNSTPLRSDKVIFRQLFILGLPVFLSLFLQQMYSLMDSLIVNHTIGTAAFSALGVVAPIYNLIIFIIKSFCDKTSVHMTSFFEKEDYLSLRQDVALGFVCGLIICLLMSVPAYYLTPFILEQMHTPEKILQHAVGYLQVLCIGLWISFVYNYLYNLYSTIRHLFRPLWILIASLVVNLILDLLFIRVFHTGTIGAAWATVISEAIAVVICFADLKMHYAFMVPSRRDFIWDSAEIRKLLKIGRHSFVSKTSTDIGRVIVQGFVNTLKEAAIAVYAAVVKIEGILTSFGEGQSYAISILVARANSRCSHKECIQILKVTLLAATALGISVFAITTLTSSLLLHLFFDSPQTIQQAKPILHILAFCTLFYFLNNVFQGYFEGMGKSSVPFAAGILHVVFWVLFSWIFLERRNLVYMALFWGLGWLIAFLYQFGTFLLLECHHALQNRAGV